MNFFLISTSRSISPESENSRGSKVVQYDPTPDRYAATWPMDANWVFHIMSPCDFLHGVTEPEFLVSSQKLGHVTSNLSNLGPFSRIWNE